MPAAMQTPSHPPPMPPAHPLSRGSPRSRHPPAWWASQSHTSQAPSCIPPVSCRPPSPCRIYSVPPHRTLLPQHKPALPFPKARPPPTGAGGPLPLYTHRHFPGAAGRLPCGQTQCHRCCQTVPVSLGHTASSVGSPWRKPPRPCHACSR